MWFAIILYSNKWFSNSKDSLNVISALLQRRESERMTKSAWSSAYSARAACSNNTTSSTSERSFSLIWVSSAPHLVGVYLAKVLKISAFCTQMRSNSRQAEHKGRRDFERPLRISLSRFSAGQHGSKHHSHLSPQETQSTAGRWRAGGKKHSETWV